MVDKVVWAPTDTTAAAKNLKILAENKYRQLIKPMGGSVIKRTIFAIDQNDGQMETKEATITFDLTISATNIVDA